MDTIIEDADYDFCCVVKLRHPWEGHAKKVLKAVQKIEGVRTIEINSIGCMRVYGEAVDVGTITRKLKKFVDSPELTTTDLGGHGEGFLKSLFRKKNMNTIVLGRYGEDSLKSLYRKKTKTIVLGDNAADNRMMGFTQPTSAFLLSTVYS